MEKMYLSDLEFPKEFPMTHRWDKLQGLHRSKQLSFAREFRKSYRSCEKLYAIRSKWQHSPYQRGRFCRTFVCYRRFQQKLRKSFYSVLKYFELIIDAFFSSFVSMHMYWLWINCLTSEILWIINKREFRLTCGCLNIAQFANSTVA